MRTPRALGTLLDQFVSDPAIRKLGERWQRLHAETEGWPDPGALITLYESSLPLIERAIWSDGPDHETLGNYQHAFRELERLIEQRGVDRRHRFFVIIPVADRPRHLHNVLESLLSQCRAFGYGGFDGRFKKIVAVVADDSKDASIIDRNREIVEAIAHRGLKGIYFGADEQRRLLGTLSVSERTRLVSILGEPFRTGMHHKGASVTRNLACLFAAGRSGPDQALFLFVDSDEQFRIRVTRPGGDEDLPALNYFHALDRLFTECDIQVATGKVVGDPPVSPAVMAGNFLVDIIAFLNGMASADPDRSCGFHAAAQNGGDAAYHDMAGLFGFQGEEGAYAYRCALEGVHDHLAGLAEFAGRLDRFFDGEHPTRSTDFGYSDAVATAAPARTVYTGNYVLTTEALRYFIPFADLKLRMAGPTLGRLLQAELGNQFVATNLPLLHTRTVDEQSEFRPGVERGQGCVDLSGEFERQFFGDVLLFTVSELIALGYPGTPLSDRKVGEVIASVEERMQRFYADKRRAIQARLAEARARFDDAGNWWHSRSELAAARRQFRRFFDNIEHNFGPGADGHALIASKKHRRQRLDAIKREIVSYVRDRAAWESLLRHHHHGSFPEHRGEEVAT
ncbi:glycosyltransferase family A protein [Thiohalomonas denitrificans]|uniref:glycosyltransferase family A protein n=1 Tax=Thiohalomonas denitrificans TaxID=415747 RepID=UPI0026F3036D|nr:glycosyltransferase family A protein [Thiohalomonas denitrificans]